MSQDPKIIMLQEALDGASVKLDAEGQSKGYNDPVGTTPGVVLGLSLALSALTGVSADLLREKSRHRARHIFSSGQDWRREINLYENIRRALGG